MGIRPEFRWWILAGGIIAFLVVLSTLALQRPNVVWAQAPDDGPRPLCPHCRSEVPYYGRRCPTCREEYGWIVAPDEASPLSPWSLSGLEAQWVRERMQAVGVEQAGGRVAQALGIAPEAARRYLDHVGRGRCGWCGGTGDDLDGDPAVSARCPACFGSGHCIACGGDRRIRVGDEGAHRAWLAYEEAWQDVVSPFLAGEVRRTEALRLAQGFLARHAGTIEATRIRFWRAPPGEEASPLIVRACRHRLDRVLRALEVP